MIATLYGTRGSLPSPGAGTTRYGGNTSCVHLSNDDGGHLILDAGSGIYRAGQALPKGLKRVDILLTHLHMDHIQGLGFFNPFFLPDVEVHIWGPPSTTRTLRKRITRYLSPPLFPIRFQELPSQLVCHDVTEREFDIGSWKIASHLITHPGPTVGYRVTHDGRSLAYLSDHEPQLGCKPGTLPKGEWLSGFSLAEGADLLLHDAQYTEDEYRTRRGWGHCTPRLAVQFAEAVAAKKLLFFHHDPSRTDIQVEEICGDAAGTHDGEIGMEPAAEESIYEV